MPSQSRKSAKIAFNDQNLVINGYSRSILKIIISCFIILLTGGLFGLVLFWRKDWWLVCMYDKCVLSTAEIIGIKDEFLKTHVSEVKISKKSAPSDSSTTNSRTELIKEPEVSVLSPSENGRHEKVAELRWFKFEECKFVWNPEELEFIPLFGPIFVEKDDTNIHSGLSWPDAQSRLYLYGKNHIDIRVDSVAHILFFEAINPFYVFQVFSVILWFLDDYPYYASCIIVMSVLSLFMTVYQTKKMQIMRREKFHSDGFIYINRQNTTENSPYKSFDAADDNRRGFERGRSISDSENMGVRISSDGVVPGDIISIPKSGCEMYCDAILLSGSCIVNESSLTGESVPVTKGAYHFEEGSTTIPYITSKMSKNILFAGTKVVQTRYYGNDPVKAIVMRTGFNSVKGELVRNILFPKPVDFHFYKESYRFLLAMAGVACIGMFYAIFILASRGRSIDSIILRTLDIITIVVPPALPAALTVGILHAQNRLKKASMFCISPSMINISGSVNLICFDKTGTLTEEGLNLRGVSAVGQASGNLNPIVSELYSESFDDKEVFNCLASCHSLTIIDDELNGDPLDLEMFKSTNWYLIEPEVDDSSKFDLLLPTIVKPKVGNDEVPSSENIGILKAYAFESRLQRMSVITKRSDSDRFVLYTKGSPEMVCSLCNPETIPNNFAEVLAKYTNEGDRVLGLAYKQLEDKRYPKLQRRNRTELEKDLTFLGLLIFENRLKVETNPVICELRSAKIRPIMVTGDNILTAVSVARQCGICDVHVTIVEMDGDSGRVTTRHPSCPDDAFVFDDVESSMGAVGALAMTGKTFEVLLRGDDKEAFKSMLHHAAVFARMSPVQKEYLVDALKEEGYFVGMCGDGANDCGALRTAHMGISLSDQEASAAAPFTYRKQNVSGVPIAIKEGRAALDASFGVFKFMAGYSFTQFASVLILYYVSTNLSDFEFLYIDMFEITLLCILFGRTHASNKLHHRPPPSKLLTLMPMLSLFSQVILVILLQAGFFIVVQHQKWFTPFVPKEPEEYYSYEGYAVFCISSYQYVWLAIAFSNGPPYRKHFFTNIPFFITCSLFTALNVFMTVYPCSWVKDLMELKPAEDLSFRYILVSAAMIHLILAIVIEWLIIPRLRKRFEKHSLPFMNSNGLDFLHRDETKETVVMIENTSTNGSSQNSSAKREQ